MLENVELDPGDLLDCSESRGGAISPILESRIALNFQSTNGLCIVGTD
jgi:hypothetical protein